MAALTTKLEGALEDFLDHCRTERSGPYDDDAFCLIEFLAEAILNAEHNESQGLPALACMLERLDECLEPHNSPRGSVLEWFDAP